MLNALWPEQSAPDERIKSECLTAPGLQTAYREIIPALMRQ